MLGLGQKNFFRGFSRGLFSKVTKLSEIIKKAVSMVRAVDTMNRLQTRTDCSSEML